MINLEFRQVQVEISLLGDVRTDISMRGGGQALVDLTPNRGLRGPKGDRGEPGALTDYDPGDLTLIFDNQLV